MAILRRRKLILLTTVVSVLVSAAVLGTHYTAEDNRIILAGNGPLLINNENDYNGPFDNFIRSDYREFDEASLKSVEAKMAMRKKRLKTACAKMKAIGLSPPNQELFQHEDMNHLIVSEQKHILYCYLPKVANTNFRRVFLGLKGVVPRPEVPNIKGGDVYFTHDKELKSLQEYKPFTQSEILQKYKKFIVVRDPLGRLLSGYRNKFFHPNATHRAEYHGWVSEFYKRHPDLRGRHNMRVDFRSKPITFKEFLIFWSDVFEAKQFLNEHFVASNQLCNPCNIHYDYVGKYETLDTDAKYIFEQLNIDIPFPGRNDNYSSVETSALVENYYRPIPVWLLKKTWDIIKFDYYIFSYHLPEWFKEKLQER